MWFFHNVMFTIPRRHHFLFGGIKCITHSQSWLGKNGIVLPTFKRPMVENPQSSDGDGFTIARQWWKHHLQATFIDAIYQPEKVERLPWFLAMGI
jgi:hypothetical protein